MQYMRNNRADVAFLFLVILCGATLFIVRAAQYGDTKDRHGDTCWWIIIARGTGTQNHCYIEVAIT